MQMSNLANYEEMNVTGGPTVITKLKEALHFILFQYKRGCQHWQHVKGR